MDYDIIMIDVGRKNVSHEEMTDKEVWKTKASTQNKLKLGQDNDDRLHSLSHIPNSWYD